MGVTTKCVHTTAFASKATDDESFMLGELAKEKHIKKTRSRSW